MSTQLYSRPISLKNLPLFDIALHHPINDAHISRNIWYNGIWEAFETSIFQKLINNFDVFIDLGANIGWYSVIAKLGMKPGSEIHAFEPDPDNFDLLVCNTDGNNSIKITKNNCGVGDHAGAGRLFRSPVNLGDHQLYESAHESRESISVPLTTLDAYFGNRDLPAMLVKMDTQGSEPRIVRGGNLVFSASKPLNAYLIEFWPHGIVNSGENFDAFIDRLETLPQRPYVLVPASERLVPLTWGDLRALGNPSGSFAPHTMRQLDLALLTFGTPAYESVADLIDPG